jgi:hypothetical protein
MREEDERQVKKALPGRKRHSSCVRVKPLQPIVAVDGQTVFNES